MSSLAELREQENSTGTARQESENFRTCGRQSPSRHAPPRLTRKEKSVPTIPSRFEVILYEGSREHLGFGSNALRWESANPSGDIPGPGNYGQSKSFHQEHDDKPSWGIRGTGGFASRSTRFGARSLPTLPKPGRGCPGPGAYDLTSGIKAVHGQKDFNQAKRTAVFAPPAPREKVLAPAAPVPGPGQYGAPKVPASASMAGAACAAFKSASERGIVQPGSEDVPGPGEYWDGLTRAPLLAAERAGEMSTVNFQEPSQRRIVRVHRDLPAADQRARDALGEFGDQVGRVVDGSVGLSKKLPGPGYYDQDRDRIWEGGVVSAAGSSAFQQGSARHDWAPPELGLLPGPGKYNPKKVVPDKLTDAVSSFVSTTERNKSEVAQAPGPCYYTPIQGKQNRSFMLNAKRQFVP